MSLPIARLLMTGSVKIPYFNPCAGYYLFLFFIHLKLELTNNMFIGENMTYLKLSYLMNWASNTNYFKIFSCFLYNLKHI